MKTILVLDDDPNNMNALTALLGSKGYNVLEAATGHEAIEICRNRDLVIDLLICDMLLPDFCGTEVALQVIQLQPRVPVLFISGLPMQAWSERDLHNFRQLPSGSVDFLEKPFFLLALETKAQTLMKRYSGVAAH